MAPRRNAPPTLAAPASEPEAPEAPELFRSAVVPIADLAATVNQWAADGFVAELEWNYFDGDGPGFGTAPQTWVHVWAWLAAGDEPAET